MVIQKQIQLRIHESPEGSIFVNSDFADIADTETIRRNLNRLTKSWYSSQNYKWNL